MNNVLKEQQEANINEIVLADRITTSHITLIHNLPHRMDRQKGKRGRLIYDASSKVVGNKSFNECFTANLLKVGRMYLLKVGGEEFNAANSVEMALTTP